MELSTFIVARLDTIVDEWQTLGRPLAPSLDRSETADLRDCLKGVLLEIARDMERDGAVAVAQRRAGATGREAGADILPSLKHGRLRQQYGIGAGQLVEEFGSLRATVLARWYFSGARKDSGSVLHQSLRFNQAIDAALRHSVPGFTQALTAARDVYLFTLAQDLRNP